jgi:NDP-sugar pyrophosphorylase family protein
MHIIIPMSGSGQRFINAGYTRPKPLIEVDSKPMIEHVVALFPGETKFTFICNEEHLRTTNMQTILKTIVPSSKIIGIPKTKDNKKGPVYAVSEIFNLIHDEEEAIVNYCDFSTYWNYQDFLKHTRGRKADGAIPSYRGFHPHMLGSTNYAFIKDENQWLKAIKEKEPFTNNRMQEFASNGTYYFKKGWYIKQYFQELMDRDINIKGEYYVSLVYNLMQRDNLKTSIYEIQHMLQWGTPEDVEQYQQWSDIFKCLSEPTKKPVVDTKTLTLIPLAGKGQRFVDQGYKIPKPLIEVSGYPMIVQAAKSLPPTQEYRFVCLKSHLETSHLEATLKENFYNPTIKSLDKVTKGQACTCEQGLDNINPNQPLLIGACDNGMLWDQEKYQDLINDHTVDAVAWTFRHNISSKTKPEMYGWVKVDEKNYATHISVKKPISDDPYNDHAIVGTFYFRKAQYFIDALNHLYKHDITINNEFYVDSCMQSLLDLGKTVKIFEVNHYICWGTPNDLKTFEYWQSFFHKCLWHPYSLEKDTMISQKSINEIDNQYRLFFQQCDKPSLKQETSSML